jgi:hypothetical protein
MTATTASIPFAVSNSEVAKALPHQRRLITPEVGRALEKLNHAIEYLTDEYVHQGGSKAYLNDHLCTVQLLMDIRKRVYTDAPEAHSMSARCRSLLAQLFA